MLWEQVHPINSLAEQWLYLAKSATPLWHASFLSMVLLLQNVECTHLTEPAHDGYHQGEEHVTHRWSTEQNPEDNSCIPCVLWKHFLLNSLSPVDHGSAYCHYLQSWGEAKAENKLKRTCEAQPPVYGREINTVSN